MTNAVMNTDLTGAESVLWDLSIFYASPDDPRLVEDMERAQEMAAAIAARYRGRVASLRAGELHVLYDELGAIYDLSGRADSYISLNYSTDTASTVFGALLQKYTEHEAALNQTLLFVELEWKAMEDADADRVLGDDAIGEYRHYLEAMRRYKPYTLSEIEEQLLVEKSVTGRSAWVRLYTQITSAMRYDMDGETLTQSQILNKLHLPDRDERHKAADAFTAGLHPRLMELTYITNVLAADKASDDKRRGYSSWISARNLSNKAPDATVQALVEAVTSQYEIVARHYRLKRALLGVDELHEYDRYAPLPIENGDRNYTWEQARSITQEAYHDFSPELGEIVARFFDENWIHAPIMPGKQGGAYCSSTVPSAHPYVFMNYLGRGRDIMTLAHELGHGVHGYLAQRAHSIFDFHAPLTTAEMASTFGEMLVFDRLNRLESDPAIKLAMLASKLEDSFSTIFRQVSMNRFEDGVHTARRAEGELATERISEIWMATQRAMFGDSVRLRDEYALWWSYIPHFIHTPGYVYAYAFGELLVLALYNLYQQRGASFAPQYLDVLTAGSSDYPENILASVGVDLNDPAFWNEGLKILEDLVTQEEALARELFPAKFQQF